ncbi:hypothetical protein DM860_015943 [Cuscuta australis]|uniref:Uncharacterized protein n=1 Tax=Cuscuta australis TaxID=267555 RepID=A0A328E001_9ASTE|nr:hypothetical protein DM860_015943 [Cuscuta australis]
MAIEICSRDSSPRMSFSGDVSAPGEPREIRSSSPASPEFNFCVSRETCESSSADELFSDGKILPIPIKRKMGPQKKLLPPPPPPPPPEKQSSAPRKLGRSWSVSFGKGNMCPLPLLWRSNSTGTSNYSAIKRSNYRKVSSSSANTGHRHHKPPLKKFMNNSGIGVNPVLNILPPARLFCLSSIFSGGKDKNTK